MKSKFVAALVVGALALPVAAYSADYSSQQAKDKPSMTEKVKENVGDAVITTKIKAEFAKDKQVSAMHINVDTDDKGMVTLKGTAKSKAEADKAVQIAKDTKGVTSVKSEIQVQ